MLTIKRSIVKALKASRSSDDLQSFVQHAIEVEHATIPPYLTAMYSLMPGKNESIAHLIRSVVMEEMLHMTIAANVLVAIGGSPQINNVNFVPKYPGKLPMGIAKHLRVPIRAFSKTLVKDVFMKIEEPEHPIAIQRQMMLRRQPNYATIGEFYAAIQDKIVELGDDIFVVGSAKQVLKWFDPALLFPITNVASATKALSIIVQQGEGTHTSPFESPGEPAHYYRFKEIYRGKKLIQTPTGPGFDGDPIPFDKRDVYPMIKNPKPSDYPKGSQVALLSQTFTSSYSSLLNVLHQSFNGAPGQIDAAIGLMFQLKLQAQELMSTPIKPHGKQTAGPVFRYVPT